MATLMNISTYLTGLNILLILSLLFVYWKNMKRIRSLFTLGLFIFAGLFLLQNVVSFYFSVTMMPYYVEGVETFVFLLTILQTFAFIILNYITWK